MIPRPMRSRRRRCTPTRADVLAIYAFVRKCNWIRLPAFVYSTVLLTIMPIVLAEQYAGPHATAKPLLVTAVYAAYVIMPILVIVRVWSPEVFPSTAVASADSGSARRRARSPARAKMGKGQ